jgi:hypothetical protein
MLTDGLRVVIDTCWLPVLDCDNIETLIEAMKGPVSPGCAILTHDFKGAATRVAAEATAFGLRRQHELVEVMAMFPHQSEAPQDEAHHTWVRSTRLAFANALPGGYPNLLGPNEYDRAAKSYGGNAEKLARIKREYDPENVFFSAIPLPDERRSAR